MAEEYSKRFGTRFEALMNCVDVPDQPPVALGEPHDRRMRLVYVGGVHLGRLQSLLDVAAAVGRLRTSGLQCEIVCYDLRASEKELARLQGTGVIERIAQLPKSGAAEVLRSSSVLLHVEPFEEASASYLRLSLSTKLPLFLSTGLPLLVYGPQELASCRYLEAHRAAMIVNRQDKSLLEQALRKLMEERDFAAGLGLQAWRLAKERHDCKGQRELLRALLSEACKTRWMRPASVQKARG